MRVDKRKRLEAKGWKVGGPKELLNMSEAEAAYIELRLKLAEGLTQAPLAKAARSSQARLAKMESGDPTVSLHLLVKSLLALGVLNRELADRSLNALAHRRVRRPVQRLVGPMLMWKP